MRNLIINERKTVPEEAFRRWSEIIAAKVINTDHYKEAKSVFCFVSVTGEPDTSTIIKRAFIDGKTVCVPRTAPGGQMDAVPVDSDAFGMTGSEWPKNYGIPEPPLLYKKADLLYPSLVIVPSVAVDRQGYRLGHGGGYYDRFISGYLSAQKRPVFMAIQFSVFLRDEIQPRESGDKPVDMIVTENEIILFSFA